MEDTLSLAFSIYNSPGVYAILLGAGISRPAGIPTGYGIVQDLTNQIISITNNPPPPNARYDDLLAFLGKSPEDRNAIIRRYFECQPSDPDGLKEPTDAHIAIAKLVKAGFVKVILTTNFDRLLEWALEREGVIPDVISSDAMLQGVTPIRHLNAVIIKLHGDYRDTGSLNTPDELGSYSTEKIELLVDIFSEYGLIVCGWSATFDKALCDELFRVKSRRYAAYWIEPVSISEAASQLIQHHRFSVFSMTANSFWTDLQSKIEALSQINRVHPLTLDVAKEQAKKFLETGNELRLEELLRDEANKAYEKILNSESYFSEDKVKIAEFLAQMLENNLRMIEVPLHLFLLTCWYGKGLGKQALLDVLTQWGSLYSSDDTNYKAVPALLLTYVCSMAAIFRGNWGYLATLWLDSQIYMPRYTNSPISFTQFIQKDKVIPFNRTGYDNDTDALSGILQDVLMPIFKPYLRVDGQFKNLFDLTEMLWALVLGRDNGAWLYHDAALYNYHRFHGSYDHLIEFWQRGAKQGEAWGFLGAMFDGDMEKLHAGLSQYRENASKNIRFEKFELPNYWSIYQQNLPDKTKPIW